MFSPPTHYILNISKGVDGLKSFVKTKTGLSWLSMLIVWKGGYRRELLFKAMPGSPLGRSKKVKETFKEVKA